MRDVAQIWWKDITGPMVFINDITGLLLETSFVVRVPDDLPWRHEMRTEIQEKLQAEYDYSGVSIHFVDAEAIDYSNTDIGSFILQEFALADVRREYRKKSGKTLTQYIVEKAVIGNDVLWVKGFNEAVLEKWVGFLQEYLACNPKSGRIVLEIRDNINYHTRDSIREIKYSDYINDYNLQLFSSLILDENPNYSENWKRYIAALAYHLCVTDAEVSEHFINDFDHTAQDPLDIIKAISHEPSFARRGAGKGSKHILHQCRNERDPLIKKCIWSAQLQVLFPLIEMRRMQFVESHSDELKVLLREKEIKDYDGEYIENPYDVEWGKMKFVMSAKNYDNEFYLRLTAEERKIINQFRECRNNIAHGDCCTIKQVNDILS